MERKKRRTNGSRRGWRTRERKVNPPHGLRVEGPHSHRSVFFWFAVSHLDSDCEELNSEPMDWNAGRGKELVRRDSVEKMPLEIRLHLHSEPVLVTLQRRLDLQPKLERRLVLVLDHQLIHRLDHRKKLMGHWAKHTDLHVFSGQLEVL